jgi:hypothetical protein
LVYKYDRKTVVQHKTIKRIKFVVQKQSGFFKTFKLKSPHITQACIRAKKPDRLSFKTSNFILAIKLSNYASKIYSTSEISCKFPKFLLLKFSKFGKVLD